LRLTEKYTTLHNAYINLNLTYLSMPDSEFPDKPPPGGPSLRLGKTPKLDEANIFTWDGNYYALAVTERLKQEGSGGMERVGPVHYITVDEIEKFGEALERIATEGTTSGNS
jgi:hypothetical protein